MEAKCRLLANYGLARYKDKILINLNDHRLATVTQVPSRYRYSFKDQATVQAYRKLMMIFSLVIVDDFITNVS